MEEWQTTKIRRSTLLRLRSLKARFGFKSLDEIFSVFLAIRDKKMWDLNDMYTMAKYGRLPEVLSVEGRSDEECRQKLGLGAEYEKIAEFEIPDTAKIGKLSKDLLGKEDEGKEKQ